MQGMRSIFRGWVESFDASRDETKRKSARTGEIPSSPPAGVDDNNNLIMRRVRANFIFQIPAEKQFRVTRLSIRIEGVEFLSPARAIVSLRRNFLREHGLVGTRVVETVDLSVTRRDVNSHNNYEPT